MEKNSKKLNNLLETKRKLQKKLQELNEKFKEEKENEEAWPGHESNFLLSLEQEYQLIISLLEETDKAIKDLQGKT